MKKVISLYALALAASLFAKPCKKEVEKTVTQTENATLQVNESYTFTLPANTSDDPYAITTQAAHSSISQLANDASGNLVFQYTPAQDYVGADKVIISTVEETHTKGQNPPPPHKGDMKGGCDHKDNEDISRIITINLNIIINPKMVAPQSTTQSTSTKL